jgi:endonuclease/exonuclease/phosphatase family metal-dependent hydrolase
MEFDKMKKSLRFLAFIFAVMMLMASCATNVPENPDTTVDTTSAETTPQDIVPDNAVLSADLSKYTVIRPEDTSSVIVTEAVNLKNTLAQKWGVTLKVSNDGDTPYTEGAYEILVGMTNRPATQSFFDAQPNGNGYGFTVIGRTVVIAGSTSSGTLDAIKLFLEAIESSSLDKTVYLSADKGTFVEEETSLRIMSFNVLCANTTGRVNPVCSTISTLSPDSVGVQEATSSWMNSLKNKLGSEYACVGKGRDGGSSGEHCAIFYKKDKYELIGSGTKWLTATPNAVSKVSDALYRRIVTYAILRNKIDGFTYVHVNTHLDNSTGAVRKLQLQYLFEALPDFKDYPIFFTGDFNGGIGSTGYNYIINNGYKNSAQLAVSGDKHTHRTYETGDVLDYIFIKNVDLAIESYYVYDEKELSDHCPIYIDLSY